MPIRIIIDIASSPDGLIAVSYARTGIDAQGRPVYECRQNEHDFSELLHTALSRTIEQNTTVENHTHITYDPPPLDT